DRPQQHAAREAVGETMKNVADHGTGRRRHYADYVGQIGQLLFARFVEQAFSGEFLAPVLEQLQERADARQLDAFDHELIARATRIGGETSGADDFHAVGGLKLDAADRAAPDHTVEIGVLVLQRQVDVTRGMALQAGDFAAYPD